MTTITTNNLKTQVEPTPEKSGIRGATQKFGEFDHKKKS
jgi:hypothetical protein